MNISSNFKEKRGSDYHEGTDYTDKKGAIINSFSEGVISLIQENHSIYGKCVWVKSKLENTVVFFLYGHLHTIDVKQGQRIAFGDTLGTMGNTGHCLTFDETTKTWRKLTSQEVNDVLCQKGVHVHVSVYSKRKCSSFEKTLRLQGLLTRDNEFNNTYYPKHWKYTNQYFNPEIVREYLKGVYPC